jgi:hypothetical protein
VENNFKFNQSPSGSFEDKTYGQAYRKVRSANSEFIYALRERYNVVPLSQSHGLTSGCGFLNYVFICLFIYDLFNDVLRHSGYVAYNNSMIANNKP